MANGIKECSIVYVEINGINGNGGISENQWRRNGNIIK
jgi:hypothetical protein